MKYHDKTYYLTEEVEEEKYEYCQQCGKHTKHSVFDHYDWEEHRCKKCGYQEGYKVR